MSRSGYSDDCDYLELYRNTVHMAIKGKRGQAFLRELVAALDAMPVKRLVKSALVAPDGSCCAMGAVCKQRALDVSKVDEFEPERVGRALGIATALAAEIAWMNDEHHRHEETEEQRWLRMRNWAAEQLI